LRYSEIQVENRDFSYLLAFNCGKIVIMFGDAKTKVMWLLDGGKKFDDYVEPFLQNIGV